MKCFHPAGEAVAICKACSKAVCAESALESEYGVACQQSCAKTLSEKNELYTLQAAHLKNIKRMNVPGSFFPLAWASCLYIFPRSSESSMILFF
jgi:hypothetical protein